MSENRYIRQEMMSQVGKAGQAVLAESRVAVIGLGALGSVTSEVLARSGVGYLRLVDHDWVVLSNLQRCALYTEADAFSATPKVLAAQRCLEAINSTVKYEAHQCRVDENNVLELLSDVDLVLDGTDNLETRHLINTAAHLLRVPWIYTGVMGVAGIVMPVLPDGPCFRCLSPVVPSLENNQPEAGDSSASAALDNSSSPAPATLDTSSSPASAALDTSSSPAPPEDPQSDAPFGVLASTTRIAATIQATLALRLLLGEQPLTAPVQGVAASADNAFWTSDLPIASMLQFDVWDSDFEQVAIAKNPDCPVCGKSV